MIVENVFAAACASVLQGGDFPTRRLFASARHHVLHQRPPVRRRYASLSFSTPCCVATSP